jgi:hypothetical protein
MRIEPGLEALDRLVAVTTLSFGHRRARTVSSRWPSVPKSSSPTARPRATAWRWQPCWTAAAPTVMQATPSTWRLLLDAGWARNAWVQGAVRWRAPGARPWPRRCCRAASRCGISTGHEETTVWSTCARVVQSTTASLPTCTSATRREHTCVWIVDAHASCVPSVVPGELLIGGDASPSVPGAARAHRGSASWRTISATPRCAGSDVSGRCCTGR